MTACCEPSGSVSADSVPTSSGIAVAAGFWHHCFRSSFTAAGALPCCYGRNPRRALGNRQGLRAYGSVPSSAAVERCVVEGRRRELRADRSPLTHTCALQSEPGLERWARRAVHRGRQFRDVLLGSTPRARRRPPPCCSQTVGSLTDAARGACLRPHPGAGDSMYWGRAEVVVALVHRHYDDRPWPGLEPDGGFVREGARRAR